MQKLMRHIWIGVAVLVLLSLSACTREQGEVVPLNAKADLQVKVYQVPAQRAEKIASALNYVLSSGSDSTAAHGRVQPSGDGRLLVLAPLGMQHSIAAALDDLAQPNDSEAVPGVELQFWVVDEAQGNDDSQRWPELSEALAGLRQRYAIAGFTVRDNASLLLYPNSQASTQTRSGGYEARFETASSEPLVAISVGGNFGSSETRLPVAQEGFVVLASMAASDEDQTAVFRRFLLMRLQKQPGQARQAN